MKTLVIYHAGCWDGFCAAWVLRKIAPDAEFHAAHYGTAPPDVTGKNVVIADFSYKRPVMVELIHKAEGRVTVLDHHKTAEADLHRIGDDLVPDNLAVLPTVVFDTTKSGGRLAWEYICAGGLSSWANIPVPWLVDYTEDRDLWRWAEPRSREVNAALRCYPLDFAVWDALAVRDPETLVPEGDAICRREAQIVDQHVRHARETELAGYKVLAVNATVLFSDIAGELSKDRPFGVCYFDRADGLRQWSLRSRDGGVDVSEVAKRFGGGGHRNAAGFETPAPVVGAAS
jgi:oligoribonuclease NrnB/cAMP/cGMP phosphodiesterase (DHH superfamily)